MSAVTEENSSFPPEQESTSTRKSVVFKISVLLVEVLAILVVLFSVLNYFNIVSLRVLSPWLSFLPHRENNSVIKPSSFNELLQSGNAVGAHVDIVGVVTAVKGNVITITNGNSTVTVQADRQTEIALSSTPSANGRLPVRPFTMADVRLGDAVEASVIVNIRRDVHLALLSRIPQKTLLKFNQRYP